jgi:5-methylcytosine-specific restriction endonuclease McrA
VSRSAVLVLNQNYQPLNLCNVRRAVSLLGRGKAEVLTATDRYLRSASLILEEPSVIRLVYMVKRPFHQRRLSRKEVFIRDRYRCQYCNRQMKKLTLDHVMPRSRGGSHSWTNIVSACGECNHRKAGRTPREARMRLLRSPQAPRPNPYSFVLHADIKDAWRPYLPWIDGMFTDSVSTAGVAAGD